MTSLATYLRSSHQLLAGGANRAVTDDAPLGQKVLNIAQAHSKTVIRPDRV